MFPHRKVKHYLKIKMPPRAPNVIVNLCAFRWHAKRKNQLAIRTMTPMVTESIKHRKLNPDAPPLAQIQSHFSVHPHIIHHQPFLPVIILKPKLRSRFFDRPLTTCTLIVHFTYSIWTSTSKCPLIVHFTYNIFLPVAIEMVFRINYRIHSQRTYIDTLDLLQYIRTSKYYWQMQYYCYNISTPPHLCSSRQSR